MGPSWKEMFPWGSWAADNPGRIGNPRLILKGPWRFDPENGLWGGSYQMRTSLIPGTEEYQLEFWRPGFTQTVVRIGPENDWPDTDGDSYPLETTLTLYLSRKRWYDCFVDLSVNRFADPAVPVYVTFLRGDGIRVPKWLVQYRKDSGAYTALLECDPDGDDHRFKSYQGSVTNKMTELEDPLALAEIHGSGDYYVDGSATGLPVAENGVVEIRLNPYSANQGSAVYQSFTNRTHRYVNVKNGGTWSGWGLITVA